ncbi:hypothetical protein MASR2M39_02140 [Ignavibacteriales bacterium]
MNKKPLYILFITIIFSTCYHAQSDFDKFPFLVLDANKIENSRSLEKLFNEKFKSDSTGSQLKIFIIGDSHVSSGEIAGSLNAELAKRFGDGGTSYLTLNKSFPSSIGQSPLKISSSSDDVNGFTLLSNTTSDKLSIRDMSGDDVEILSSQINKNRTIQVKFSNGLSSFYISSVKNVPPIHSKGIITTTAKGGVTTTWYGSIGASLLSYNVQMNYIYPFIEAFDPDILIVNLGTNDCTGPNFNLQYVSVEYEKLILKLKKNAPKASFLLISPPDFFGYSSGRYENNKMTSVMKEGITKLSLKHDLAVWDLKAVMGGDSSMVKWVKADIGSKDYIHFTTDGQKLIGKLLAKAIIDLFKEDQ